jgi:transposase InsO family protein
MFSRSKAYANSCLTCGERKIPRNQTKAPMRPQPISNTPFGTVVIDFIGPITASFGRRYMLVMICEFTRYAVVVPTTCMDASVTARALMDHLILLYGCPNILKSDNGGSFVNSVIFELARILNIQLKRGQPWHPQAHATCERLNGTIMTLLSMYARNEPRKWYLNVRYVVFTYNCNIHMSTKLSPYRMIFNKFQISLYLLH